MPAREFEVEHDLGGMCWLRDSPHAGHITVYQSLRVQTAEVSTPLSYEIVKYCYL